MEYKKTFATHMMRILRDVLKYLCGNVSVAGYLALKMQTLFYYEYKHFICQNVCSRV